MRNYVFAACFAIVTFGFLQSSYAEVEKVSQAAPALTAPQAAVQLLDKTLDKTIDGLKTVVTSLSDALKKVAPEVWRIMVRQQYVTAVSWLTPLLFVFAALIYSRKKLTAWAAEHSCNSNYCDICTFTPIIWWVIACVILVVAVCIVGHSIPLLLNPEYYAIKELVGFIK